MSHGATPERAETRHGTGRTATFAQHRASPILVRIRRPHRRRGAANHRSFGRTTTLLSPITLKARSRGEESFGGTATYRPKSFGRTTTFIGKPAEKTPYNHLFFQDKMENRPPPRRAAPFFTKIVDRAATARTQSSLGVKSPFENFCAHCDGWPSAARRARNRREQWRNGDTSPKTQKAQIALGPSCRTEETEGHSITPHLAVWRLHDGRAGIESQADSPESA